jgi:flagellar FliL protein
MAKKDKDEKKPEAEATDSAAADGAAPASDGAAPAEEDSGKSKKKLIMMIAAGVVLLLVVAGAGLYFTGMLDSLLGKKADVIECEEGDTECEAKKAEHAKEGGEGHEGEAAEGHEKGTTAFLPIPTMIVNLSNDDGTPRYLRLTVQLELKSAEDVAAVEAVIPRVIDQFQTYLRELRVRDLRGSAGIYRLQMELLWRVNQAAAPVEVKDVLFQEILIQ